MKKFVSICLIVTFLFIVTPPVFADNIEMDSTIVPMSIDAITVETADDMLNSYYLKTTGEEFSISESEITPEDIEAFVEAQVENNVIANTNEARGALTKAAYRAIFTQAANYGSLPWPIAGNLLGHSLQDNPSNLSFFTGSYTSNEVYGIAKLQNFINQTRSITATTSSTSYSAEGSYNMANSGNMDLRLALGKVDYKVIAFKSGSYWQYVYTVEDVYNYEYWDPNVNDDTLANIIRNMNNVAADAQEAGAIVPYKIYIYYEEML